MNQPLRASFYRDGPRNSASFWPVIGSADAPCWGIKCVEGTGREADMRFRIPDGDGESSPMHTYTRRMIPEDSVSPRPFTALGKNSSKPHPEDASPPTYTGEVDADERTVMSRELRPVAIVGPTASGKTALSLALCEQVGGEVVNMDSMQLYRGMDIGTAKVPVEERRGIAHHLLDVWNVTDEASVQTYQRQASAVVEALLARGVRPVLVGGSMMYYQSLIDSWNFPPTDHNVRKAIEQRLAAQGIRFLHAELAAKDPAAAEINEEQDARRTVRALEVIELTGEPYSATIPSRARQPRWDTVVIGLRTDSHWLNPRIEERTRRMFNGGLVEETRALVRDHGLIRNSTAGRAIGYAQVLDMDAGELTAEEAIERTMSGTRRYVRRQRSWFQRDKRITWLDASIGEAELATEARAALDSTP